MVWHAVYIDICHSAFVNYNNILAAVFVPDGAFTRLLMRLGPRELRHHQRRGARQLQSLLYASKETALYIPSRPIVREVNVPCQHQLVARWWAGSRLPRSD